MVDSPPLASCCATAALGACLTAPHGQLSVIAGLLEYVYLIWTTESGCCSRGQSLLWVGSFSRSAMQWPDML